MPKAPPTNSKKPPKPSVAVSAKPSHPKVVPIKPRQGPAETHLHLRRVPDSKPNHVGLYPLRLTRFDGNGKERDHIIVFSGAPGRQVFNKAEDSDGGSLEPIPEGTYQLGSLDWAGKDAGRSINYERWFSDALGPIYVRIDPVGATAHLTGRAELGFHWDANRVYAPGSAGCVVFDDLSDVKQFVGWFQDEHGPPVDLLVNYGHKTVPSLAEFLK